MNKYSEVGWGLSGLMTLIVLVVISLLGLNLPITLGNVIFGMIVFAGGSILSGVAIFFFLVIYFSIPRG